MRAKSSMAGTIVHEATQRTYGSRERKTKWTNNMDDLEGMRPSILVFRVV